MSRPHMKACKHFFLSGSLPPKIKNHLIKAVESIPHGSFFDQGGNPLRGEIVGVDKGIEHYLNDHGWNPKKIYEPVECINISVDLYLPTQKVLIEIEKSKQPRLELDIIKIASACLMAPKKWQFGVLVVPTSYIELRLKGGPSPYQYLERLGYDHLIAPQEKDESEANSTEEMICDFAAIAMVDFIVNNPHIVKQIWEIHGIKV